MSKFKKWVKEIKEKVPKETVHSTSDAGVVTTFKKQLRLRDFPIAIGVCLDETMFSLFFSNWSGLDIMPWDAMICSTNTLLPEARNKIHDMYLDNCKDKSHLLMFDSDVLAPPGYIERMLSHNKPMVAGYYNKKEKFKVKNIEGVESFIQRPVVYNFTGTDKDKEWYAERFYPGKGLEKVDGAGAGAWLMRRDVAEALGRSPYSFDRGGEDLTMCYRVKELGFDMFIDWDVPLAHLGVWFV